ncbi:FMN reductase [Streptomyces inusitatus]|uniref:FMN reductase n=1 Tax=Streptomyces inusitatus TaxID=68221 RepID=A0A918UQH4_9ACTN|nr:NAD(P)H-dependent oxidoreductase [Streptomyces inusitatus]GGZ28212.1 FMN reductase [Streptomyces inusitatus]
MNSSTRENPRHTQDGPAPDATAPLKLVVILSSNREGRFGPVIADWFLEHAELHRDFQVSVVDLGEEDLPTALTSNPPPSVAEYLGRTSPRLAAADAFVVITPEYNHSFPASIKSLIDWHFTEWRAKPVAFVSYGGLSGGLRAVEQLRLVFAELHAVAIRDTVSFHHAQDRFDGDGRPKDPAGSDAAAVSLLDQLAWWGHTLRDAKAARPYTG